MAKKAKAKVKPNVGVGGSAIDTARRMWLAGLGAFARAETEGSKLFDALVIEGEAVEAHAKKLAGTAVGGVKGYASETWENVEELFQDRVSQALTKLGVPTHEDIQHLSKQVAALDKSIKELTKQEGKPRSPRRVGAASHPRA